MISSFFRFLGKACAMTVKVCVKTVKVALKVIKYGILTIIIVLVGAYVLDLIFLPSDPTPPGPMKSVVLPAVGTIFALLFCWCLFVAFFKSVFKIESGSTRSTARRSSSGGDDSDSGSFYDPSDRKLNKSSYGRHCINCGYFVAPGEYHSCNK